MDIDIEGDDAGTGMDEITPLERERCLDYLVRTRDQVVQVATGLTPAQWEFKPTPARWSIAEILEHLAALESIFVEKRLTLLGDAPAGAADRDYRQIDEAILQRTPIRSRAIEAPEPVRPRGRWTPEQALKNLVTARARTIEFLEGAAGLRQHVLAHPVAGPLDGYQWLLMVAAHTDRHLRQIDEVKAASGFPAAA